MKTILENNLKVQQAKNNVQAMPFKFNAPKICNQIPNEIQEKMTIMYLKHNWEIVY